ncbi:dTDP-4-dehydrorhamnose reductase [Peptococcaceae bacterium CEB3]|nr:dTDP-4-dehydrorhamnose reductase [Peptococcaceae bacterium CEB3]
MEKTRVLILGASGMLGHKLFQHLSRNSGYSVYAAVRSRSDLADFLPEDIPGRVWEKVDAHVMDSVVGLLARVRPDVVINAIGIVKQSSAASDPLTVIPINALFPHRLAEVCLAVGAKMIQISTDCVFDGKAGNYRERDLPNPPDLYGRSKLLGEVVYPHCLTLRTSIIGHELRGHLGLLDWFLGREERVRGFTEAVYSGLTTPELARVIGDYVIPQLDRLQGLYHLSAAPISKYDLLRLLAAQYRKNIVIEPDGSVVTDKSLNSGRFCSLMGYLPPSWEELVVRLHEDFCRSHYHLNIGSGGQENEGI